MSKDGSKISNKIAHACVLENSCINISSIREDSKLELLSLLDSIKSKDICMVLDSHLIKLLNHIFVNGTSVFKEHGVKEMKDLSKNRLKTNCTSIVYLVRPVIRSMRHVAMQVKEKKKEKIDFYLNFVSRRTLVCEEVLKREGVFSSLIVNEYHLDFIPMDDDVLSLELNNCFRNLYLDNDKTQLMTVADSINKLQTMFGVIPNVRYKGSMAKVVCQMMTRNLADMDTSKGNFIDPEIDSIVILDRNVDMVSCLCTPLTYEGLIDEIFGIRNGAIMVDANIVEEKDEKDNEQVSISLNSNDSMYAVIRDFNTSKLGGYLSLRAKEIRDRHEEFRKDKSATINDLHEFVKLIPGLKQKYYLLGIHINVAEIIQNSTEDKAFRALWTAERSIIEGEQLLHLIEDMISDQESLMKVLRLLCLQSITSGGIKAKTFDAIRRLILQAYGYELLLTLNNLEKVGLIKRKETLWSESSIFSSVRKSLRLVNSTVDVHEPNDISYVTSGYAPISVRLVEAAMQPKGWSTIQDSIKQLAGPAAEFSQVNKSDDDITTNQEEATSSFGDRKVMLVYFLGGVTYMEIAALRYLSRKQDSPYDIIIATTKLINGNNLVGSLIDKEMASNLKDKF